MSEENKTKTISVTQEIIVDASDNNICSPKCRGFIDKVRHPSYEAKCKMFIEINDLNLEVVKKNNIGCLEAKFHRCQECIMKEINEVRK